MEIVKILLTVHFWDQARVESKHLWQDMSLFCVQGRVTSDSDLSVTFFSFILCLLSINPYIHDPN